jgi:hypothetical protein
VPVDARVTYRLDAVFELSFGQKKNQNLSDPGIGDFQSHLIDDPKLTNSR